MQCSARLLNMPNSHNGPPTPPYNPKLVRTPCRTFLSNIFRCSLHIFAASTFAGLSSFGSASMLITDIKIFSTLCIGLHRSLACS
jgi:hypothetical protein